MLMPLLQALQVDASPGMQSPFYGSSQELDGQAYHRFGIEAWNLQVSEQTESYSD